MTAEKAGRQFAKPLEVRDAFVSLFWIPPIPLPALGLFQPVLDDPAGYTAGDGEDNRILLGALLELASLLKRAKCCKWSAERGYLEKRPRPK